MSENLSLEFKRTTIHPWPFDDYGHWRGFFSRSYLEVTDNEVTINGISSFKIEDIEFCNVKKRWFGIGNSQITIGVYDEEWQGREENKQIYDNLLKREKENEENKDEADDSENAKNYGWQGRLFFYRYRSCYLKQSEVDIIVKEFKDKNALCYRDDNISIGKGNRTMWLNENRVVGRRGFSFWWTWMGGISTKDIEFATKQRRLFGFINPKFRVGVADWFNFKYNWVEFDNVKTNCSSDEIEIARAFLKSQKAICYAEGSSVITTYIPKWNLWRLIFSDTDSVWMNQRHIISDKEIGWWNHGIIIPQIKFFYTKGLFSHNLYLGARGSIRVDNISSEDKRIIEQHLKDNGAKIALDTLADYQDVFTLGDITKIKNWFVNATISVTESGIKMMQKTFKTTDNIYLPFDKINYAETYGDHSLLGARYIRIYGEQHIMPLRKFKKSDVTALLSLLEEHGVHSVEGERFSKSYHSTWIGILISIITISIWHWIVVFFTRSKKIHGLTIDMTQKKASWEGPLYIVWREKNEDPQKDDSSKLTFDISDLTGVMFYKKRWFHLWGYVCFDVHPYSFRDDQMSKTYVFVLGKCWSGNAKTLIQKLEQCGHSTDYSKELRKDMKWWCKYIVKNISK